MAYKRQLQIALDRLDQGLARVHSMIKRGKNADAIYFMENNLKELYEELENIINITPEEIELDSIELSKESNPDSHSQKN